MSSSSRSAVRTVGWIATALAVIGALNWALVGLFSFNLVAALFGAGSAITRIIYVLVGVAGLYLIYFVTHETHEAQSPRAQRPAT